MYGPIVFLALVILGIFIFIKIMFTRKKENAEEKERLLRLDAEAARKIKEAAEEEERRKLALEAAEAHDKEMRERIVGLEHISVLGIRGAVKTRWESGRRIDVNYALYSLLFFYNDGHRMLFEVSMDDMHYFTKFLRV